MKTSENAMKVIPAASEKMRTTPDKVVKCVHVIPQQGLMQDGDESQKGARYHFEAR